MPNRLETLNICYCFEFESDISYFFAKFAMEFPELGQQCYVKSCQQIDFLPIKCSRCQGTFCKDHSSLDGHACSSLSDEKPIVKSEIARTECSLDNCSKDVMANCPLCRIDFCMNHRLEADHKCASIGHNVTEDFLPKTKAVVDSIIAKNKAKANKVPNPKTVKNQKLTAKVNLMKLKQKAEGPKSIPNEERIYFSVKSKKGQRNVFVSKVWPFGKVLDTAADLSGIENKNNTSTSTTTLKLFKLSDGFEVSSDLSVQLQELVENQVIFNGDTLILDYVENETIDSINPGSFK